MPNPARHQSALTTPGRPDDLRVLRSDLVRVAAARKKQLLKLRPVRADDRVAIEHHASVRRILDAIHAALDRMDAGTYGDCAHCGAAISLGRLSDRPWTSQCEPCARRPQ